MAFFPRTLDRVAVFGRFFPGGGVGMGLLRVGALRFIEGRCCGCSEAWVREFWSSKRSHESGCWV